MTISTTDLRSAANALLTLADHIDIKAPGLLPENEDVIFAIPSLIFRTEDAAMLLSYEAALSTFLQEHGDTITARFRTATGESHTHRYGPGFALYLSGPAPAPVQPEESPQP